MESRLMSVQSRQPGGGLIQVFAALLVFPLADSFRHHGDPWFAIPVVVVMAAVHVALLLPSEPSAPRIVLPTGVLGIALIAGLSIWLSNHSEAWSVGMLLAAVECSYIFGATQQAMAGIIVLTVLAGITVTHSVIEALVLVLAPGTIATLRRRLLVTIDKLNAARTELADYAVAKERQRVS